MPRHGSTGTEAADMDLEVEVTEHGDFRVLGVKGEVDVFTAPKLREQMIDLVEQGHFNLIVDLSSVDFLDSTGLGVLVGGLKRVKTHDGSLRLVCSNERILKIFSITGLTSIFPIHATLEEALADPPGS
jgi:anti-sigma B factor antagonist